MKDELKESVPPSEEVKKVEKTAEETDEKVESVDESAPEKVEKDEKVEKVEKVKKAKKPKKKKPKFVDDGRTVYSMEGLNKHKTDGESLDMTKKEKRALIKAALAHYLPIFLGVIGCFSIAAIIMYLWLH